MGLIDFNIHVKEVPERVIYLLVAIALMVAAWFFWPHFQLLRESGRDEKAIVYTTPKEPEIIPPKPEPAVNPKKVDGTKVAALDQSATPTKTEKSSADVVVVPEAAKPFMQPSGIEGKFLPRSLTTSYGGPTSALSRLAKAKIEVSEDARETISEFVEELPARKKISVVRVRLGDLMHLDKSPTLKNIFEVLSANGLQALPSYAIPEVAIQLGKEWTPSEGRLYLSAKVSPKDKDKGQAITMLELSNDKKRVWLSTERWQVKLHPWAEPSDKIFFPDQIFVFAEQ
ncbi:MAG: hypothetical protein WA021_03060 [Minisyncoccia bacterium]